MKTEAESHRLRIFVNESDRWEGKPLYEAIVRAARDRGLAGATALRGIEGFGANDRVHTVKVLRLSEDLPIVIEVVDRPDRIAGFLPTLDTMVAEGMVTIETVHVVTYKRASGAAEDDELQLESSDFMTATDGVVAVAPPAATTENYQKVLTAAKQSATEARRVFADSVDILRAMLCESKGIAERALKELGIDCKVIERSLDEEVSRDEPTKSFLVRLEKHSQAAAKWLGDEKISTEHLLLALCELRPSTGTDVLMRLGALPRDICGAIFKIVDHEDDWQRWMADHPDM
jgi:PII-like signaling protein